MQYVPTRHDENVDVPVFSGGKKKKKKKKVNGVANKDYS